MENSKIINKAQSMLSKYVLCDHCLGRQFAQLLTNTSNEERGKNIRYVCAMYIDTMNQYTDETNNYSDFDFHNVKILRGNTQDKCFICGGVFDHLEEIVDNIIKVLEGYEYDTFLIGIVPKRESIHNEETLWEEFGIEYVESLKEELSREIGKLLQKKTNKKVDFNNPDVTIIVDLNRNLIDKKVRSLYIYGKYNKYTPMPQTKWVCSFCHGLGCEKCNYTGKLYKESVEELIGNVILSHTKGINTHFHGAGREDIDALCHGWREFVIEIEDPKIRSINLKEIEEEINRVNKEKIEVKDLRMSSRQEVKKIKEKRDNKIYKVEVVCKHKISQEDVTQIKEIRNLVISQQTPLRVKHRRADKIRKKKIHYVDVLDYDFENNTFILRIKSDAGTYIKEFISGDEGRTRPSLSSLINNKCEVKKLIVEGFESNE